MSPFSTAVVRSRLVNIAADCSQMKNDSKISGSSMFGFCYNTPYYAIVDTKTQWCGFFDEVPGSGLRDGKKSDPGWEKFGSGINISDPQNCLHYKHDYEFVFIIQSIFVN
jgi:hypothetical protein